MDLLNLTTLFNIFFSLAAFACVLFIAHIRHLLKERNLLFHNAETLTGRVISIKQKNNTLSLPLIEYEHNSKIIQFTSTVASGSVKEGESIELQLATDGSVRVATTPSNLMIHVLSASMAVFFILGCLFVYNKFLI